MPRGSDPVLPRIKRPFGLSTMSFFRGGGDDGVPRRYARRIGRVIPCRIGYMNRDVQFLTKFGLNRKVRIDEPQRTVADC